MLNYDQLILECATYNLLTTEEEERSYIVYDRIAFMRGGKHDLDLIERNSKFCNKIWFYLSHRIDGKVLCKDACAVSFLSSDQIDDFDFSETIARLKTLQKMKDLGLRGPRNGYQPSGKIRYRSFKTETIDRYKFLSSPPLWVETDSIKVPKISEKDLILQLADIARTNKRIIEPLWQNT